MGASRLLSGVCLIAAALALGACAETNLAANAAKQLNAAADNTHAGVYKVGDPYQINGVWYYPAEDYSYDKTGIASWYGPDFHGKATANGELYDMNALTAAHQTLPMPSLVRVTNLENGRSINVRVNDRGPYANGRIIDMSRRAAQLLGFEQKGTAKVRIEIMADESRALALQMQGNTQITAEEKASVTAAPRVAVAAEPLAPPPGARVAPPPRTSPPPRPRVKPEPPSPPAVLASAGTPDPVVQIEPVHPSHIFIQAGAFTRYDNANRLSAQLSGLAPARVQSAMVGGTQFYRVRLGPLDTVDEADTVLDKMIKSGYPEARIIVD